MWAGAVTNDSATIVIKQNSNIEFLVSVNADLSSPLSTSSLSPGFGRLTLSDLTPSTRYYYGVSGDIGTFKTFGNRMDFIKVC